MSIRAFRLHRALALFMAATPGYVTAGDSDADGVDDANDACCATPAGLTVDAGGRPLGDATGDCDVDLEDYTILRPVMTLDRFAVLQRNFTGVRLPDGPCPNVCGNGVVEPGEECEPPGTPTCDPTCHVVPGIPPNDTCALATAISETSRTFSTIGATTDGPDEPGSCVVQNYTQVDADVWFCFTSPVSEPVIVSLCGSQFDTKLMIYDGCACPPSGPVACSDDQESVVNCGTGTDSRARFNALAASSYLIRIGGFQEAVGTGQLTIFRQSDPHRGDNACNALAGDCYDSHADPGCHDPAVPDVCQRTCAVDRFCCDTQWDFVCVTKADGIAHGFPACGPSAAGSCLVPQASPGCLDEPCITQPPQTICQVVCEADPFCCLTQWDAVCVDQVGDGCGVFAACHAGVGSCFVPHGDGGCNGESCCNAVCREDPYCCEDSWDGVCVSIAVDLQAAGRCP
ncbi:MAG: hypothetical protein HY763_14275 [Planctomycetes bacterium]|nr:hypothetical protein [Planctomycetota bacterium]